MFEIIKLNGKRILIRKSAIKRVEEANGSVKNTRIIFNRDTIVDTPTSFTEIKKQLNTK